MICLLTSLIIPYMISFDYSHNIDYKHTKYPYYLKGYVPEGRGYVEMGYHLCSHIFPALNVTLMLLDFEATCC